MAGQEYLFTSESVTEGHPDKVCDTISDAILDACLAQDPKSRVACETLAKSNLVVLAGEITTKAKFDYVKIVRDAIREIGYTDKSSVFNDESCQVLCALVKQSPDIAQGVDTVAAAGKLPVPILFDIASRIRSSSQPKTFSMGAPAAMARTGS